MGERTMPGTIFFSRCRPQKADVADIAVREGRVFVGYPAWLPGVPWDRRRLRSCVADLTMTENEWRMLKPTLKQVDARFYQMNRNLFGEVLPGAIALVPRPSRGVVYAGRVKRGFELLDDPPWADDYLALRRAAGLDASEEAEHAADVAQSCEVDQFRVIPLLVLPAWIRNSLFGRATLGRLRPVAGHALDPFDYVGALLDGLVPPPPDWTSDLAEVRRRLLAAIGPNSLEHLCVALLQLEHPKEVWAHVGGSGDGGVDGIGANAMGATSGLLQCKWEYPADAAFDVGSGPTRPRLVVASLLHPDTVPGGFDFWGIDTIAGLVLKHAAQLPAAISMRVGSGPPGLTDVTSGACTSLAAAR